MENGLCCYDELVYLKFYWGYGEDIFLCKDGEWFGGEVRKGMGDLGFFFGFVFSLYRRVFLVVFFFLVSRFRRIFCS